MLDRAPQTLARGSQCRCHGIGGPEFGLRARRGEDQILWPTRYNRRHGANLDEPTPTHFCWGRPEAGVTYSSASTAGGALANSVTTAWISRSWAVGDRSSRANAV